MSDFNKKKTLHPLSRKAKRVTREGFRVVKKVKQVSAKNKEQTVLYHKVMWFKSKIEEQPKRVYSAREIAGFIEEYIQRNDDQLLDLEDIKRKVNRSNTTDLLQSLKDNETLQFNKEGYLVPDISRVAAVKWLTEWDGNMKVITNLPMKRFKAVQAEDEIETTTTTTTTTTTDNNNEDETMKSTPSKPSLRTQLESPATSNPFASLSKSLLQQPVSTSTPMT
ncbi:hypothetical protein SAMD00019534_066660 [Acytostelium subglobosum LB1]|uniref:hypothetical protein n=1 Tax=Acytostelium subglobosum LB1 TaxID=1410327 RepID=UPI000644B84F|nr:hypothetical protein SAMD00019534_066660 [Acytostelium subglobosum LB1]GAM23491.1 hypothetical protein SAMD00019534_066660 [Acytostelium subglobosum LB1]|eukprot:XP_012753232.1 hypothetical protein SAMD00019534_066660 [Acytostelium subglobosum LB1]